MEDPFHPSRRSPGPPVPRPARAGSAGRSLGQRGWGWALAWAATLATTGCAPPEASIRGRVVDSAGRGVEGASVWLTPAEATGDDPAPRLSVPGLPVAAGTTDATGAYELDALPSGPHRPWAFTETSYRVAGPRVDLVEGLHAELGPLVLEPVPTEQRIEGAVRGPQGPLDRAVVTAFWDAGERRRSRTGSCRGGRFLLLFDGDEPDRVDLVVRDPDRVLTPRVLPSVAKGRGDVEVELVAERLLPVEVRTPEGQVVREGVGLGVTVLGGVGLHDPFGSRGASRRGADGGLAIPVVANPFHVRVSGSGRPSETFGPFDPDLLGERLTLSLEQPRYPEVRVVVRDAAGRPVKGATVEKLSSWIDPAVHLVPGVERDAARSALVSRAADPEGRHTISRRRPWAFDLRAGRKGMAVAPVEVPASPDDLDVEIRLAAEGELRGRIRVPRSVDVEDVLLVVRFEGGARWYERVGEGGAFSIQGLAPGWWTLAPRLDRLVPLPGALASTIGRDMDRLVVSASSDLAVPEDWPFAGPWRVRVPEGGLAELEPDWSRPAARRVSGRLLLDGARLDDPDRPPVWTCSRSTPPSRGWWARLVDRSGRGPVLGRSELDPSGRFEIPTPVDGELLLRWDLDLPGGRDLELARPIAAGEGALAPVDIETGALVVDWGERADEWHRVVLAWRGPDGLVAWESRYPGSAGPSARLDPFPAGDVELLQVFAGEPVRVLARVEVPRGGEARVALPDPGR